jgi:hypothetical protein
MHLDFGAAALREHGADGAGCELRRIAIAAEMTEHHALDFSGKKLLDHGRGRRVRKMAVARLDPLLHRPGAMRIVLQKFLVMVRFDHEGMHVAQALDHHLGGVTEIGDEPKRARTGMKGVSDRIDRIVRDRKGLDMNIADGEIRSRSKQPPVPVTGQGAAADRFGRERVAVDRDLKFAAEHFETTNVIAVLVGQEHAIELSRRDSTLFQAQDELARAQSAVDQEPAMTGRDERAVAGAAAAEHGQREHERLVADALEFLNRIGFRCTKNREARFDLALGRAALHHHRMKPIFLSILLGAIALIQPAMLRADEVSHRKAAESLLSQMNMDAVLSQTIDQTLQMQIKANPAIAPYEQEMKNFLKKYMSWAGLQQDMVKLYADAFTESELNELSKFYQTPVGKKTLQQMPVLMSKGAEIGQRRVQEHLPELQNTIAEKEKAKGGAKKP